MLIRDILKEKIEQVLNELEIDTRGQFFVIEHPDNLEYGDYSTNAALVLAKKNGQNPHELAQKIATKLLEKIHEGDIREISEISIAGPGFINLKLSQKFFNQKLKEIYHFGHHFGKNKNLAKENMLFEYTDPNPFKQFHIGHLMSNSIGESLSRLAEWNGAEIYRACYQGDVGMHVAKTLWGMQQNRAGFPHEEDSLSDKLKFLGSAYVLGANQYKENPNAKAEINKINAEVYALFDDHPENDNQELKIYYEKGKEWSLKHFEEIYEKLGTAFNKYIYESQMFKKGVRVVNENLEKVFEVSEGAIVYRGEKDGLHTRVFINSEGLPTYEAKDLGLAIFKETLGNFDKSVVITASEQKEYFKVMLAALRHIHPEIISKTEHITHGMMRFQDGKMSSRTGNVISGEELIEQAEEMTKKILEDRDLPKEQKTKIASVVAIAALKFAILKQSTQKDIIYNPETAVSLEGDSGPYLQYTYTRAKSVIEKAAKENFKINFEEILGKEKLFEDDRVLKSGAATGVGSEDKDDTAAPHDSELKIVKIEKLLYRFEEIVEDAWKERAPHNIVNYLLQVAAEFNSFYANEIILDESPEMPRKLAVVLATQHIIKNGLYVLGIKVPERM